MLGPDSELGPLNLVQVPRAVEKVFQASLLLSFIDRMYYKVGSCFCHQCPIFRTRIRREDHVLLKLVLAAFAESGREVSGIRAKREKNILCMAVEGVQEPLPSLGLHAPIGPIRSSVGFVQYSAG